MGPAPGSPAALGGAARRWLRLLCATAAVLALAVSARAGDQPEVPPLPNDLVEVARRYASVVEWQGFFEVEEQGSSSGNARGACRVQSATSERRTHGRFKLEKSSDDGGWDPRRGMFAWTGSGELTAANDFSRSEWFHDGQGFERHEESAGTVKLTDVWLTIRLKERNVSFGPGALASRPTNTITGYSVQQDTAVTGRIALTRTSLDKVEPDSAGVLMPHLDRETPGRRIENLDLFPQVAGGPGVFNFSAERPGPQYQNPMVENGTTLCRSRVLLFPVYDAFEVEVTIDGYPTWRPAGSIEKPAEPGNSLVARATLKPRGGSARELPRVELFRFQLLDTSREPGVCLNWPCGAKDQDYDLRLALAPPSGGELSDEDQKLEVRDPHEDDQGRPYAEAKLESFDFGAKSELQVTCILEDGREVVGLMKGEGGEQDLVRLPWRTGPEWVAESWRREKKAGKLAASDDGEHVAGQTDDGDGFTLYEEYRGWVVDGKHVEGDPERKDFFVLNLIGADARPGIELFEQLSKLLVHSRLRRGEMSQTLRLMNGNHRDAPHRVAQHGVWVKTFASKSELGDNGAATVLNKAGVAGRPGLVKGIGILARDDTESAFNQPFNLPAQDSIFAYDRAIAHELLHTVGVEHHGSGDYRQIVGYVSPRNPSNKVGRPYYGSSPDTPLPLLDEAGHDVATRDYVEYVKLRKFMDDFMLARALVEGRDFLAKRQGYDMPIKTPEQYADAMIELLCIYCFMHLDGTVGVEHGEHSGDQDCVMRYSFARFYEARNAKERSLYLVTPGTERIGMQLCRSGTGTGINAADHRPQSRYGNAAAGAGTCSEHICPNDAIPPRRVKK